MLKSGLLILLLVPVLAFAGLAQSNCSAYDTVAGPFLYQGVGTDQHLTGGHWLGSILKGSCTYTGSASYSQSVGCDNTSESYSQSYAGDNGTLSIIGSHGKSAKDAQGISTANNGGAASSDAIGTAAFERCLLPGCTVGITISGSGNGGGFTIAYSPAPLWSDSRHLTSNCSGRTLAQAVCTQPPQPPPVDPGPGEQCWWVWNAAKCEWVAACKKSTPILIDTTKGGFRLSDPQKHCVLFDLENNGKPECYSWPEPGSGNAWLVYDRDGDGKIDSGAELFGNFTPHADGGIPKRPEGDKNGFLALAWFDRPEQGGNLDLLIDKHDEIWFHLRLWIDEHCYQEPAKPCSALPSELHSLESRQIFSLSLVYTSQYWHQDQYGNDFKFSAVVNPKAHRSQGEPLEDGSILFREYEDQNQTSEDGRLMVDVNLQVKTALPVKP